MHGVAGGELRDVDLPVLETERLRLAVPDLDDSRHLLEYAVRNREHMAPWIPPLPPDWNTLQNAERRARQYREQAQAGVCFRFWARRLEAPNSDFVAGVTLNHIVLGPRRACLLGYHVDARYQGRGYVFEAARAAIGFAFQRLLLHRIEAGYVPDNERSARVLERLGFVIEGYARGYLFVGGRFQDHVMTGLVNDQLVETEALCTPSV